MRFLDNPDLAIPLYLAVVFAAVLLTKSWQQFLQAAVSSGQAAQTKAATK